MLKNRLKYSARGETELPVKGAEQMRPVSESRAARRVAHQVWCCAVCAALASLASMAVVAHEGAWGAVEGVAVVLSGCAGAALGTAAFRSWRGGEA